MYDALVKQLGDKWCVFHRVSWPEVGGVSGVRCEGESDFVVAHPSYGVLLIAVEGGVVQGDIATGRSVSRDRNGVTRDIDPLTKLHTAKQSVVSMLRAFGDWDDASMVIGHALCFPDNFSGDVLPRDAQRDIVINQSDMNAFASRIVQVMRYWRPKRSAVCCKCKVTTERPPSLRSNRPHLWPDNGVLGSLGRHADPVR